MRKVVDKHSHVASREEIKENEYSLNIQRYVDTFEEEEITLSARINTAVAPVLLD